jgi:transposase
MGLLPQNEEPGLGKWTYSCRRVACHGPTSEDVIPILVKENWPTGYLLLIREGGVAGLRQHPPPGATPRLSLEQRSQLLELLAQGAEALGFQGDVWTQPRVATLIRDWFGVLYDPSQVGRILKAGGWSSQKPVHRATQRNEEAIWQWQEERWPEIKKGHSGRTDPGLCGPVRLLPATWKSAHLCPNGPDPHYPCSPEPRPPSGHGRDYAGRQAVPDGSGEGLPRRRCCGLPEAPGAAQAKWCRTTWLGVGPAGFT